MVYNDRQCDLSTFSHRKLPEEATVISHEPEHSGTTENPSHPELAVSGQDRSQPIRESLLEACRCAKIADGFRGENTLVLDLTKVTPIFDFFVLTTGTSRRQMQAIAEEINKQLKDAGTKRQGLEGNDQSQWIVQDYGNIVVHIFSPELREVYDLERLWADAPPVDWRAVLEEMGERGA